MVMESKNLFRSLGFIILLMISVSGQSQLQSEITLPTIVPASSEATNIAKYINYPVEYCNGLVKIEIPLFELRAGDIVLPVSLSYHASGLKVNENSGIIGSGWTLNAEPLITRSIDGLPDFGDYVTGNINCQFSAQERRLLASGTLDASPDQFFYKLINNSGSFYFKKNCGSSTAQIVTVPYEPVRIVYNSPGFTVTDEKGLNYFFVDNTEYSGPSSSNTNATAFKADYIMSASTKKTIHFQYTAATETVYNVVDGIIVSDDYTGPGSVPEVSDYIGQNGIFQFPVITSSINGSTRTLYDFDSEGNITDEGEIPNAVYVEGNRNTVISTKLLTHIFAEQGDAVFTYDLYNCLTEIVLLDNSGLNVLRRIKFYQTPFNMNSDKWKLDSLSITDNSGLVTYERYRFGYNNPSMVPVTRSKNIDHWGYCNNSSSTIFSNGSIKWDDSYLKSAIPRHKVALKKQTGSEQQTLYAYIGDADRNVNEEYMKSGVLSFIRYPTGGEQTFTYEAHRFNHYGNYGFAGGLRIESIEDFDPVTHQRLIRRFKYGENENGCGFINHLPTPNDYMFLRTRRYDTGSGRPTSRTRTYSSWALSDLFRSSGSPVIYRNVTEYRESSEQSTRILYEYNVIDDNVWWERNPEIPFPSHTNENWMFYKLSNKSVFDNDKQSFIETNGYQYGEYKNLYSEYITNRKVYYDEDYAFTPANYSDYPEIKEYINSISMGCIRLTKEIVEKDEAMSQTTYTYQNTTNLQPTQISRTGSDGVQITENFVYPHDHLSLTGDAQSAKDFLANSWQVNAILQHKITKGSQSQTTRTDYKIWGTGNTNNPQIALPAVVKTSRDNTFEDRIIYHSYDKYGNPSRISYANGPSIIYLWGYKYEHPIARIENASMLQVLYILDTSNINSLAAKENLTLADLNLLNQIRTRLPEAMVSTYSYNREGRLASETDPSGRKTDYEYDNAGRLIRIKDATGILHEYEYRYMKYY
jgi:YD repeat-containing protein